MDNILLILALFAVVKSLFMTSLLPNRWYRLAFSLSLGLFLFASHPFAIELNKLELQRILSSRESIMNISLFVMVDMLMSLYFSFARLKDGDAIDRSGWYVRLFRLMPSLLIYPALFYLQIMLLFSFTGVEFLRLTAGLALAVVVIFSAASFLMRRWIMEKDILIELVILLSLMLCALVICCTIFHPSATVYSHSAPVDWIGAIATIGCLLILLAMGFLWAALVRYYNKHYK